MDDRLPHHAHVRDSLDLRDVHLQLFLVPVGKAEEIVIPQHEGALPLRRLVRHLVLLHHVASDQDDECKAHGQSHRLDGGVKLVAGQEFQETSHNGKSGSGT